jgi:undecaprenyl-phosphate galactose phosphotransferase/putative colanic acid biosynthesis UDP-glucose lipid carrier transferase
MTESKSLQINNYIRYIKLILIAGDLLFLNLSYIFSFVILHGNIDTLNNKDSQIFLFVSNIFWLFLLYHFKENSTRRQHIEQSLSNNFKLIVYLFLSLTTFAVLFNLTNISRMEFIVYFLNFTVFTFAYRVASIMFLKKIRKAGNNFRNVVIIGGGDNASEINAALSNDLSQGYKILGFFDDKLESSKVKATYLGPLSDVTDYAIDNQVHEIYITLKDFDTIVIRQLINFCEKNLIRIKFIPDYKLFQETNKISIDFYGKVPVISLRIEPLEIPLNRIKKRAFDILFSLSVITFIFPWLFPILLLFVKLSSKGPIFFSQKRSGEGNRSFWCYKFRTMRVNQESDVKQATENDSRITKVGKFMRKTSLDELPQFFNVLIGNMSVVGPRPHMLKHTKEYSEIIDKYIVRHFAKPGITGWAQTHGFKGETINIQAMEKRVEHDIWYIENWSFFLDIKIIFLTIKDMFNGLSNHIENSRKSNTDEEIIGKKLPLRLVQSYSIANSLNHKKAFKSLRSNLNNSRTHRNLAK